MSEKAAEEWRFVSGVKIPERSFRLFFCGIVQIFDLDLDALLSLMMKRPNVLLMDEPPRNLSPLSAPVMRDVIRNFPGAVICVTHDRILINEWPGRVLRLTKEGLIGE